MQKPNGKTLALGCSILALGYSLIAPTAALADTGPSESGADVGVLAGVAFANQDIGGHFTWGATAHYKIMPNVNIGAFFSYYSNSVTLTNGALSGSSYDQHYTQLAAEANYLFDMLPGAYLGLKMGIGLQSTSLTDSTTSTHYLIGPDIGYDVPIGSGLSLGGQINVLYETSSPNVTATNLLAVLKYNFG